MSSRRKLKKDIKKAFGELFADCVTLNMCHQADEKKIAELMTQTLAIRKKVANVHSIISFVKNLL